MKFFNLTIFLLATLSLSLLIAPIVRVRAEDEVEENEEEDAVINEDGQANQEEVVNSETEEESAEEQTLSSPFVKTNYLFVQPESSDLPAGRLVRLLVGFQNNGSNSFLVESIDGSFRYPQDFSYHIQNFSVFDFNKVVDAERESTFEYLFTPSETFSQRQFGLTINLRYRNQEGKQFVNTVFNETVNVVEPEEGLDGETFFLYVFLAAIVVLLGLVAQQFFNVFKKKTRISRSAPVQQKSTSNGTNSEEVDMEWIPKEHLQTQNNKSPKVSPRQRKSARNGAAQLSASGNSSNDEQ